MNVPVMPPARRCENCAPGNQGSTINPTKERNAMSKTAKQRDEEMWRRVRAKRCDEDECTKQALRAILVEHDREDPRETAAALAWTILLRTNFEQLSRLIGPMLERKGRIHLSTWGPYLQQHIDRLIGSMVLDDFGPSSGTT
jgi:hypothetical protein